MRQNFYKPLGFVFLLLAIIGVLMPILPGTPFLLLSAWFFARSSERWHRRLLKHQVSGPILRDWEQNQCIGCRTKMVAILSMVLAGGASIIFAVQEPWIKILGAVLMTIGTITVLSIKTCRPPEGAS